MNKIDPKSGTTKKVTQSSGPPAEPRLGKVRCISRHGFHDVAYRDWGDETASDRAFCVHGLTRNAHDYDPLAARLAVTHRVICPDLPGRGQSDWLNDPSDYHLLQYNMDMTVLLSRFGYSSIDWVGTSLGGLIGIALAGLSNTPIRRLIINDIAPEIPYTALRRITSYAGNQRVFESLEEVEAHLRETLAPFGPMTDADWARMAKTSSFEAGDGYHTHHDPDIMQNFRQYFMFMHFNLWKFWEKITCPVLILRGTDSDFLPPNLLDRMIDRLPSAEFLEFEGVGHTPTLNSSAQIDPVVDWLRSSSGNDRV
ncbi:alpha/beta fold hydrolase [Ruegeria atlantica]|uniref:alpha/beta fold hydrolase n=1 Tax=Ruegeria atlantica TaxID=81569 RepID=UPI00147E6E94|nr:alpha/beta hydrolase [Ruegeria atlantica]